MDYALIFVVPKDLNKHSPSGLKASFDTKSLIRRLHDERHRFTAPGCADVEGSTATGLLQGLSDRSVDRLWKNKKRPHLIFSENLCRISRKRNKFKLHIILRVDQTLGNNIVRHGSLSKWKAFTPRLTPSGGSSASSVSRVGNGRMKSSVLLKS